MSPHQPFSKLPGFHHCVSKVSGLARSGFKDQVETKLEEHSASLQAMHNLVNRFVTRCEDTANAVKEFKRDEGHAAMDNVGTALRNIRDKITKECKTYSLNMFERVSARVDELSDQMIFMESTATANSNRQKATSSQMETLFRRVEELSLGMKQLSSDYEKQTKEFAIQKQEFANLQDKYQALLNEQDKRPDSAPDETWRSTSPLDLEDKYLYNVIPCSSSNLNAGMCDTPPFDSNCFPKKKTTSETIVEPETLNGQSSTGTSNKSSARRGSYDYTTGRTSYDTADRVAEEIYPAKQVARKITENIFESNFTAKEEEDFLKDHEISMMQAYVLGNNYMPSDYESSSSDESSTDTSFTSSIERGISASSSAVLPRESSSFYEEESIISENSYIPASPIITRYGLIGSTDTVQYDNQNSSRIRLARGLTLQHASVRSPIDDIWRCKTSSTL